MNEFNDEEILFLDEEDDSIADNQKYKILIVDDEATVHDMTTLALKDIEFKGCRLELLHAYSAKEAKKILINTSDIAVIFLDVIMETDTAGLDLVKIIREDIKNTSVRIILRTGQPGLAPEEDVIVNYDINDYKDKTELTVQKLFSSLISALRSYSDLLSIKKSKNGLEKVLKSTSSVIKFKFIDDFFEGLLEQVLALISANHNNTCDDRCTIIGFYKNNELIKVLGTGKYKNNDILTDAINTTYKKDIEQIFLDSKTIKKKDRIILHKHDAENKAILLIINGNVSSIDIDDDLLEIFIENSANIYDCLLLTNK